MRLSPGQWECDGLGFCVVKNWTPDPARFLQRLRWAVGLPLGTWAVRRVLLTEGAHAPAIKAQRNQSLSPEPVPSG